MSAHAFMDALNTRRGVDCVSLLLNAGFLSVLSKTQFIFALRLWNKKLKLLDTHLGLCDTEGYKWINAAQAFPGANIYELMEKHKKLTFFLLVNCLQFGKDNMACVSMGRQ